MHTCRHHGPQVVPSRVLWQASLLCVVRLAAHFRFGGKQRVCRDEAAGEDVIIFKHSLMSRKQEGRVFISPQVSFSYG